MSWKINELDRAKTEQSIANEEIRLDHCHEEVMRLINEADMLRSNYEQRYQTLCERIDNIKKSIENGEEFIEKCKEHLKNDFNED